MVSLMFSDKFECPSCRGHDVAGDTFTCAECGYGFGAGKVSLSPSTGERIFNHPKLYEAKVKFLGALNRFPRYFFNDALVGKDVLDLGCGAWQYLYDPNVTRFRVGMDIAPEAVLRSNQLYPSSIHIVRSISEPLPFKDKSFDVCVLSFVLHHLERSNWEAVLAEASRVSRSSIIIADHICNTSRFKRFIQMLWWKDVDGGRYYAVRKEWEELLRPLGKTSVVQTGTLFGNMGIFSVRL